jgi:hypothetical protein
MKRPTHGQIFKREIELCLSVYRCDGWDIKTRWAWFNRIHIVGKKDGMEITLTTPRRDAAFIANKAFLDFPTIDVGNIQPGTYPVEGGGSFTVSNVNP